MNKILLKRDFFIIYDIFDWPSHISVQNRGITYLKMGKNRIVVQRKITHV